MRFKQAVNFMAVTLSVGANDVLAADLTIARSNDQVVLTWPRATTNDFYVQVATNLAPPPVWNSAADPATNADTLAVTDPAAGPSQFYRLQAWEVLFDGTNTAAFRSSASPLFPSNSWVVTSGTLASRVVPNATSLMTIDTYTNFELRFAWKCETNGNSGIFYRGNGNPEYQLFDDANVASSPYRYVFANYTNETDLMGAVFGKIAPTNKTLVPTRQWNECRIVVQGYHSTHWLNGHLIIDYQINDPAYGNYFTQATNTHVFIQNKGTGDDGVVPGVVYFRDIKIRSLP